MRQVNLSECIILNTISPPHCDATVLFDIDGDGHNELCVASSGGFLNVFKPCSEKSSPWVTGCVNEVGEIVILTSGVFIKGSDEVSLVVVTGSSALLVKVILDEKASAELVFNGTHAPRNVTAGVILPDNEDMSVDVLVVSTYDGDIHIVRFDNVMPLATLSHGSIARNLDHMKPVYRSDRGITSLAKLSLGSDTMLAIGLVDGSFELLKWPTMQLFHREQSMYVPSTVIRRDVKCTNIDQSKLCVSTLSGDLMICELITSVICEPDNSNGVELSLSTCSLTAELDADEPLVELSAMPSFLRRPCRKEDENDQIQMASSSFFAVVLCSGKTIVFEYHGDLVGEIGSVDACVFDPAAFFTSPMKSFVTGKCKPNKTIRARDSIVDEPCLIYVLGNGEVLVFHSIAAQIGESITAWPAMDRLQHDLPISSTWLKNIDIALFDQQEVDERPDGPEQFSHKCVNELLTDEVNILRKLLYFPTEKIEVMIETAAAAAADTNIS
jgi:hypothetical protein